MNPIFHPTRPIRLRSGCAAALLASLAATGGRAADDAGADVPKASWETEVSSSAVDGSRYRGARHSRDISERDMEFSAVASLKVREGVLIRLGANYERFDFAGISGFDIPRQLQSFNLVFGTDLQLGEAWLARLEIQPGLYAASTSLRSRDLNVPLTLGASYFSSADLQWVIGLSMDLNRKYPVLPGVGVRWKMSEKWVLDAILPTPRIEYSVTRNFTLYAGGKFDGGSYRTDGSFGTNHGDSRLNNAIVDYTQIRVGAGATFKIGPSFTFEVEGGCVPTSQIDFHRASVEFRSAGAPVYGAISLKAAF